MKKKKEHIIKKEYKHFINTTQYIDLQNALEDLVVLSDLWFDELRTDILKNASTDKAKKLYHTFEMT